MDRTGALVVFGLGIWTALEAWAFVVEGPAHGGAPVPGHLPALVWDGALLFSFALLHSLAARALASAWGQSAVPHRFHALVFATLACVHLVLVCQWWRTSTMVFWTLEPGTWLAMGARVAQRASCVLCITSLLLLEPEALVGLTQVCLACG
jgi:hypothetical protein